MRVALSVALLVGMLSSFAAAQASWSLTTSDFRQQDVTLAGVSAQGVQLAGGETIGFDRFLQIQRTINSDPKPLGWVLCLTSGDRLYGDAMGVAKEKVSWRSPLVGDVAFPMRDVRAFVSAKRSLDDVDKDRAEDMVVLSNNDSVKGAVMELTPESLTIRPLEGDEMKLQAARVVGVYFATTAGKKPPIEQGFRVRLMDDSRFRATAVAVQAEKATLTLADKSQRTLDLSAVLSIEQVNGPVSWLSTRPPAEVVQTPYFAESVWPTQMDKNVTGGPIRVRDRTYLRGIGVHSYSRLVWDLDGGYDKFRTQYAVDGAGPSADVTVRIKLDDKVVHEQEHVKANQLSPVVELPLKDAKKLTLEVDYGANYDVQDRFDWLEPALVKTPPPPPPPPPPVTLPATPLPPVPPTTVSPLPTDVPLIGTATTRPRDRKRDQGSP